MKKINGMTVYEENDKCSLDDYSESIAEDVFNLIKENRYDDTSIKNKLAELEKKENISVMQADIQKIKEENEILISQIPTDKVIGTKVKAADSSNMPIKKLKIKGISTQETRSGKNLFDLSNVPDGSSYLIKTETGINLNKCWLSDVYGVNSFDKVQKTFKPNTTYTMRVKAKVVSRPSTILSLSRELSAFRLYRPNSSELGTVWVSVLNMPDKETIALNTEKEYITSFTTPADMTDVRFVSYCFYGNNDGSTTGTAQGEIDVSEIMLVEGTYTASNFPNFELYGASPSPEFPSKIRSIGDDINLINNTDIVNGSLRNGNILSNYKYRLVTNTPIVVDSSENCIINYQNLGEFKGIRIGIHSYDADGNFISDSAWMSIPNTFKTEENCKSIRIVFSFSKTSSTVSTGSTEYTGDVTQEEFKELQMKLQKGTVSTPYSKYGEGTLNIEQRGKNKLINSSFRENWTNWWISNNGTIPIEITEKLGQKCLHITGELQKAKTVAQSIQERVEKGKTYTLSCMAYLKDYVSGTTNPFISFYTDGKTTGGDWTSGCQVLSGHINFLPSFNDYSKGFVKVTATLKVLDDTDLTKELGLYVYARDFTGDLYVYDVQLEEGTEATDYEEYFNKTYTLPLSEPLRSLPNGVKDTLEADGIHRKVGKIVLDGSSDENWGSLNSAVNDYKLSGFVNGNGTDNSVNYPILSNYFKSIAQAKVFEGVKGTIQALGGNLNGLYICFGKDSTVNSIQNLSTWLSTHNTEVIYELETETIEPYTDEQKQIISSVVTSKGTTYFTNKEGAEMEIEYYKDLQALFNKVISN